MCPDGCSGHGQCHTDVTSGDSTCTCDIKWEGTGCGEPGCPTNDELKKCSGHGSCITEGKPHEYDRTWKCACSSGFTGEDCSQPSCPNDCTKRGECRDGVCICASGFTGDGCEIRSLCGPSCERFGKKYGHCDNEKMECVCKKGYEGFDCLYKVDDGCSGSSLLEIGDKSKQVNCGKDSAKEACLNDCSGSEHGACIDGECMCKPGFYGPDCSSRNCPSGCNGHGTCDEKTGKCTCSDAYTGIDCGKDACEKHCNGKGVCDKNSKCNCIPPFFGKGCSKKECAIGGPKGLECSGFGQCGDDGRCDCPVGRTGHACEREVCVNECSGHGMCFKSKCYCDEMWEGADCGEKSCPNDCSDKGVCVKKTGKCKCNEGYFGEMCEKSICQVDCGINGHCDADTKKCVCTDGYGGMGCQTPKVAGSPEKASADDDSKSNGKDSDDSKTQNSKKAAKGQGAERFKRVSSKTSATSKLIACSATCSNDCGQQVQSLSKEVDAAQYATKCNIDCTKKCLKN